MLILCTLHYFCHLTSFSDTIEFQWIRNKTNILLFRNTPYKQKARATRYTSSRPYDVSR